MTPTGLARRGRLLIAYRFATKPAALSRGKAALAQQVRALDCGSRGPRFEPERWYHAHGGRPVVDCQTTSSAAKAQGKPPLPRSNCRVA